MCKLKLFTIQIAKLEFIFIILNNEIKIDFEIHRSLRAQICFPFHSIMSSLNYKFSSENGSSILLL